jgi:hypothetical protein
VNGPGVYYGANNTKVKGIWNNNKLVADKLK